MSNEAYIINKIMLTDLYLKLLTLNASFIKGLPSLSKETSELLIVALLGTRGERKMNKHIFSCAKTQTKF